MPGPPPVTMTARSGVATRAGAGHMDLWHGQDPPSSRLAEIALIGHDFLLVGPSETHGLVPVRGHWLALRCEVRREVNQACLALADAGREPPQGGALSHLGALLGFEQGGERRGGRVRALAGHDVADLTAM